VGRGKGAGTAFAAAAVVIGTSLGPYELRAELGSGGMGTVYLGVDGDGRRVALKVVHSHLVSKQGFRERFRREADVGRRIRHRNVVATFGAGETEVMGKPLLYLAMEYVDGQTLRELLDEIGRVPEELCSHIGREVARALAAIHGAGVFHRDLKPENVLITADNEIKVMDLGVAVLADASLRLSQTGAFAGSVLYAAPERFGDEEPDARSDLYGLGLLLYELATGEHPFGGDDVAAVIEHQLHSVPRPAAELNPQLSPFFEEVLRTLLLKQKDERFGSAGELGAVLEGGESVGWWHDRARAIRAATARPLRRIRIPRETRLHGREDELARLKGLYDQAAAGQGRVVFLEGEAGIGKTRLVHEFAERLFDEGEDLNFLFGSYPPGGAATAAGAFSTAYREHLGDAVVDSLPGLAHLVPAFEAVLCGTPPPREVAPLLGDALLNVFVQATLALAAERPTIVAIEDLHFAPETGRAIFAALAAAAPGCRLLLIGTARPGVAEEWTSQVLRPDHACRLGLRRLTPKELSRLLQELFRSQRLADELGWRIATKSDGNPFFVFEFVRSLEESNLIAQRPDGAWAKTQVIADIKVPSTVLDLIEARMAELGEEDQDLLAVAACCGFEFDPLVVAAALGVERIPAIKRLARIERGHRLVRAVGRRYVFDHHQVQEALYRGLPELLRESYHAALGAALARRHPDSDDGAVLVDLCEHFLRGAEGERAQGYLPDALDHLTGGYLHDRAIALVDRALDAPGLLESTARAELLLRKASALELRGRHEEDRETLGQALALADAAGVAGLQARVRIALGRLAIWGSDYEGARAHLNEARELAERAQDVRLEAKATGNLGIVLYRLRRFDEARAMFQRALTMAAELGEQRGVAVAAVNLGNVAWCLGLYDEARAHYQRYRDLSKEVGYREGEALAIGNLGNVAMATGRLADALERYEEVLAIAAETGDRHQLTSFTGRLGAIYALLGRLDEARDCFERSLQMAREIGMPREASVALDHLAGLAEERGDREGARRLIDESMALRGETDDVEGEASGLAILARLDLAQDNEESAARRLDLAIASSRREADPARETLCRALRARLPRGDPSGAEALLEERESRLGKSLLLEIRYHLWKATGQSRHLAAAQAILASLQAHAPDEDRERLVENVALHRAVAAGEA